MRNLRWSNKFFIQLVGYNIEAYSDDHVINATAIAHIKTNPALLADIF